MNTTVSRLNALNDFLQTAPMFEDAAAWRRIASGLQKARRVRESIEAEQIAAEQQAQRIAVVFGKDRPWSLIVEDPAADLAAFQRVGIVPPGMAQGMAQHEATVTRLLRELTP